MSRDNIANDDTIEAELEAKLAALGDRSTWTPADYERAIELFARAGGDDIRTAFDLADESEVMFPGSERPIPRPERLR